MRALPKVPWRWIVVGCLAGVFVFFWLRGRVGRYQNQWNFGHKSFMDGAGHTHIVEPAAYFERPMTIAIRVRSTDADVTLEVLSHALDGIYRRVTVPISALPGAGFISLNVQAGGHIHTVYFDVVVPAVGANADTMSVYLISHTVVMPRGSNTSNAAAARDIAYGIVEDALQSLCKPGEPLSGRIELPGRTPDGS